MHISSLANGNLGLSRVEAPLTTKHSPFPSETHRVKSCLNFEWVYINFVLRILQPSLTQRRAAMEEV